MTLRTRLVKLEKAAKPAKNDLAGIYKLDPWPDYYPRALDTLAQALSEITGQENTQAEVENELRKLSP